MCMTDRSLGSLELTPTRDPFKLPPISKSQELLYLGKKLKTNSCKKKQTNPQSPPKDSYYFKLPQINQKNAEKSSNLFTLSRSQLQSTSVLGPGDKEQSKSLKKYNKQIADIQYRHNQYLHKIEELYMLQKRS